MQGIDVLYIPSPNVESIVSWKGAGPACAQTAHLSPLSNHPLSSNTSTNQPDHIDTINNNNFEELFLSVCVFVRRKREMKMEYVYIAIR